MMANVLKHKQNSTPELVRGSGGILAVHRPLVISMLLILGNLACHASRYHTGLPGQPSSEFEASSTFDSICGHSEDHPAGDLEEQLWEMFREVLLSLMHRLSEK